MSRPRLIARIALFAALVYVTSWVLAALPGIKLTFFIIFTASYVWGIVPGIFVGMIGTGLYTTFNPFGPAPLPIMFVQILGSGLCGVVGAIFSRPLKSIHSQVILRATLVVVGLLCTSAYHLPVDLVDAWLFQPFKERFLASLPWTLTAVGTNMLIFPLLFDATRLLYQRETSRP